MTTVTLSPRALELLQGALARLYRRADRLGLPRPEARIIATAWREHPDGIGAIPTYTVEVSGGDYSLGPWRLAGKLEWLEGEPLLLATPGGQLPPAFRQARPDCDHCGLVRNRAAVYLLTDGTQWKQVGSSCLRAFTGLTSALEIAELYASLAGIVARVQAEGEAGEELPHQTAYLSLTRLLEWTATVTRQDRHFISRRQARETGREATADRVALALSPGHSAPEYTPPTDADRQIVPAVIEWAQAIPDEADEYLLNLRALASAGVCQWHHIGLACSALLAYRHAHEQASNRSDYVGTPGQKLALSLRLEKAIFIPGQFPSTLYIFRDEDGNILTWKTNAWHGEPGTHYGGTATVKEHREYRGTRQTAILRAKLEEAT